MPSEWIEALHIIGVVCWFAALFYLPRLFVYHAQTDDQPGIERFVIMEGKLYRGIATPAMVASLIFGLWLFSFTPDYYLAQSWFIVKASLVLLLVAYHGACWYFMVQFRENRNQHSHTFFRWFNELPVLALIGIIVMVVVRPF